MYQRATGNTASHDPQYGNAGPSHKLSVGSGNAQTCCDGVLTRHYRACDRRSCKASARCQLLKQESLNTTKCSVRCSDSEGAARSAFKQCLCKAGSRGPSEMRLYSMNTIVWAVTLLTLNWAGWSRMKVAVVLHRGCYRATARPHRHYL